MDIDEQIAKFLEWQKKEAETAKAHESDVGIDPDTYVAKEIFYQSALLHQILHELKKLNSVYDQKKSAGADFTG